MNRRSPPSHLFLGSGFLPEDFPDRLKRFKEEAGLTWEGVAMCVDADPRQVQRWRDGTAPCGDALFSLFKLAARVPGGVQLLLGEDVCPPATTAPTLKDRLDAATGRRGGKPQTGPCRVTSQTGLRQGVSLL